MLPAADCYDTLLSRFAWAVPARYNIAVDTCDKWADGSGRLALIHETAQGDVSRLTFDDLRNASNRLANSFVRAGLRRGDRIGIFLAQGPETAVAHLAAYKLGAIAVPLFTLFGADALEYRLANSDAAALVTDAAGYAKIAPLRTRLPALRTLYCIGDDAPDAPDAAGVLRYDAALAAESADFSPVDTAADDPALIIYTSGTTGKPKGALHAHRVLLGHLPGVEMSQQCFPRDARLFWTPADWAWIGGLLDVLLPSWHHGVPVLARRFEKFDGAAAFDLMARHGVTHAFLPPTALKLMRTVPQPRERYALALKSVASGGESLGSELTAWGRDALGVTINEFYGQTECNMVLSSCAALFAPRPGAIGKAVPGHRVAIVDAHGAPLPPGVEGRIAVRGPDPVMFLEYWRNPDATRDKFAGDYLLTGDTGVLDADGFVRFVGRDDDVITSAGYRIGPGPIEDCLLTHPAVRMAAVVGVPDATRTEIVKAFVVLNPGYAGDDALVQALQAHVKTRLAAHEYPRAIAFVDGLPMTATGKIVRRALRDA
ncbi:AMP-dependent synthetase [Burkholderia ubonensis]|uniref:acyl-CoA synthetase n=2 Tax=Burkholderia ubonensis TaxID=101571 RepID=UPI00075B8526|nr:acyl-CoA synthetase [Burkholderia ubonensis]KVD50571.1 AMP-dependent synthetase [Burkholderia ubonensis]KVU72558.1 AMP-dependent synthetase [Burkholderia ubonensis]KVU83002.1 AMP-dependent synthetase [Burkholderia ubonensis]KVU91169.1 AMP-dependent synthetase [Burkholderia ubonensis]KWH06222.1 AMP-dependent synthetase [Burkholderia ubonensis]